MAINKYIVMMRFGDSKSFNLDKGFISKDDAKQYVSIMKRSNQDKFVKYYLFEQSVDFQEHNDTDQIDTTTLMQYY